MIKIAIVEDEKETFEKEKDLFLRYQKEHDNVSFEIIHFESASEFLNTYDFSFDAVTFDIDLNGENGLKAARVLRRRDKDVVIFFVTNLAQYAVKGYEVEALDFLVKPVSYEVFKLKMKRFIERIHSRSKDERELNLKSDNSFFRVKFKDIRYVETSGHKVIYHTTGSDVTVYGSMKKAEEELKDANFIKCNQCYLVNPAFVLSVDGYVLTVGEDKLQISRPQRKNVMNAMMKYMSK